MGWSKDEPIDAGIEVAERTQPLTELIDTLAVSVIIDGAHALSVISVAWIGLDHWRYARRDATNAERARRRSAARPNGVSAESAA